MKNTLFVLVLSASCLLMPKIVSSQAISSNIESLERRVARLEHQAKFTKNDLERVEELAKDGAPLLFLFGIFCALWAQNTGRNAWLWFFLGAFFHVITVLVLLAKNERREFS